MLLLFAYVRRSRGLCPCARFFFPTACSSRPARSYRLLHHCKFHRVVSKTAPGSARTEAVGCDGGKNEERRSGVAQALASQRDESLFATTPVDERRAGWGSQGSGRPGSRRGRVGEQHAAHAQERAPCYARRGRIERPLKMYTEMRSHRIPEYFKTRKNK